MVVFLLYWVCRVVFGLYNSDLVGSVVAADILSVLRAGTLFDSLSIFYINLPFILFALLPLRQRAARWYQRIVGVVYVVFNAAGLFVNIADIFYFPFKLSRIASDDLHYAGEDNFATLMTTFLAEYWAGLLLWLACVAVLIVAFRFFRYAPKHRVATNKYVFYGSQTIVLLLTAACAIVAIRGYSLSKAAFPISMSSATQYVKPQYASLVLSNPFCLIRTLGKEISYPRYMEQSVVDSLVPVRHRAAAQPKVKVEGQPNVMFIILESFGRAHIKSLSDNFSANDVSFTPFLDSLVGQSYTFTNAYQSGLRSIDALPAIWASIPSFKVQFLSLPQSVGEYGAVPALLGQKGYETLFFHGAVRESMDFVAFGKMAGVKTFFSREDYESERGTEDFDGKWGIFDHKFLPFIEQKLSQVRQPFCATLFTLSSHHPYTMPLGMEDKFPKGRAAIQQSIAYSDYALREFFREASKKEWFANTIFVITGDHGSMTDSEKYKQIPYNNAVPILFYAPSMIAPVRDSVPTKHIDIMPTLLSILGYDKEFFAFGRDAINDPGAPYAIVYNGGTFNMVADSLLYRFDESQLRGVYCYKSDPMQKEPIEDTTALPLMKAFIQQYYRHIAERDLRVK